MSEERTETEKAVAEEEAPSPKKAKASKAKPSDDPRTQDWGFPRFAKDFPRNDELDALVAAFARGDYGTVREKAPKLASETTDEDVRRAAKTLRERIEPDPTSRLLFVIAAVLLAFLTAWWVSHDGPEGNGKPPPAVAPK